jgi:ribokinase
MSGNSILVLGSSNTDMIIKLDRLPKAGETILGGEFVTAAGGKGANQAVAAARAGGKVTFIAQVGKDVFGEKAVAGFLADGINVEYVFKDPARPSGVALIFVAKDGENSIAVASGANANLLPSDVWKARNAFSDAMILLLQLETPLETIETAAELAVGESVRVILNPAPARPLPDGLLKNIYLVTPNESEAELLTGITVDSEAAANQAVDKLFARGVQNVVLTMGARGAFVATQTSRQMIPAFKTVAVDATGAGDIFNGSLAVALAEGKTLLDAARFATAAAAISVSRLGAQTSAPMRKEIEQLLASDSPLPERHRNPVNNAGMAARASA